ncbi:hypothetical protein V1514DRAFT_346957 [Lipomyces japonicus]|uniref:uncharacterized protein n=1 Tax=Lipomyces japonicus TaxID=56871 RepID=UPI0034CD1CCB
MTTESSVTAESLVSREPVATDLTIGLHPLALLNISDFYTRARLNRSALIGGLIGKQNGRDVSIEQAFEFPLLPDGSIAEDIFVTKLEQFKSCFADLELIGWFFIATSPPFEPSEDILPVHEYVTKFHNDTPPLLLVLNTNELGSEVSKLPITIYETVLAENSKPHFVEVQHRIDSFEAEHIGVLYVAKQDSIVKPDVAVSQQAGPGSSNPDTEITPSKARHEAAQAAANNAAEEIISQLNSQSNAVKMLHSRLQIIQQYLLHVQTLPGEDGLSQQDCEILRQVDALVGRLTTENTSTMSQGLEIDGLLAGLLGLVTKGTKYGVDLNAKRQILDSQKQARFR